MGFVFCRREWEGRIHTNISFTHRKKEHFPQYVCLFRTQVSAIVIHICENVFYTVHYMIYLCEFASSLMFPVKYRVDVLR